MNKRHLLSMAPPPNLVRIEQVLELDVRIGRGWRLPVALQSVAKASAVVKVGRRKRDQVELEHGLGSGRRRLLLRLEGGGAVVQRLLERPLRRAGSDGPRDERVQAVAHGLRQGALEPVDGALGALVLGDELLGSELEA